MVQATVEGKERENRLLGVRSTKRAGFDKPGWKNIRELARSMEHANVNHKCRFGGMAKTGKESCLKIPRRVLPKECIDETDKGTNCIILRWFSSSDYSHG